MFDLKTTFAFVRAPALTSTPTSRNGGPPWADPHPAWLAPGRAGTAAPLATPPPVGY